MIYTSERSQIIKYCSDYEDRMKLVRFVQSLRNLGVVDEGYCSAFYTSLLMGG